RILGAEQEQADLTDVDAPGLLLEPFEGAHAHITGRLARRRQMARRHADLVFEKARLEAQALGHCRILYGRRGKEAGHLPNPDHDPSFSQSSIHVDGRLPGNRSSQPIKARATPSMRRRRNRLMRRCNGKCFNMPSTAATRNPAPCNSASSSSRRYKTS